MGRPGLEPGANRLKAEYSTIELVTLYKNFSNKKNFCKKLSFIKSKKYKTKFLSYKFKLQKNLKFLQQI